MPWTLYRYILADLLRVIGLTTAVLVTVIAFGATIKPLASDRLLDAEQTARYIVLVIVPMLQFALPFAAGFGSTLTFFRLVNDNEIVAMAASGISYRRVLTPLIAFGIVLMLLMVVLTQWVIPQFWTVLNRMLAADIPQMLQASIARNEAFQHKGLQIYADEAVVTNAPEGVNGPSIRMTLLNVAAADMAPDGRIVTDVTSRQATVDVYRTPHQLLLKLVMLDAVAVNVETGQLVQSDRFSPRRAIVIQTPLTEHAKTLSIHRMAALWRDPDQHSDVTRARWALADALRTADTLTEIGRQLQSNGFADVYELETDEVRSFRVIADGVAADGKFSRTDGSKIDVIQTVKGVPNLRFAADLVQLQSASEASPELGRTSFDLTIGPHEVMNLREDSSMANRRGRLVIGNVTHGLHAQVDAADVPGEELLATARAMDHPSLAQGITKLQRETTKLRREIVARLMNRFALSLTAPLLLLLGAVMAMWLRGGLPLATYAWAFLPAVLDLILISAGEQFLRDGRMWGHAVMWSGNALMLFLIINTFRKVART